MSYEILYKRFLVREKGKLNPNGKLIPYIIHGSNNCYEATYTGRKRERCVTNLFNCYEHKSDLKEFLGMIYDKLTDEHSGFLKGISKTKKGFIKGFNKKIINEDELTENGIIMEERLNKKFRKKRKNKSVYDYDNELKNIPFKTFSINICEQIKDKTIIAYSKDKNIIGKGKIKKLPYVNNGDEYGFFKTRYRNRYIKIYSIGYYKIIK